jgi:hypothetical protein
MARTNRESTPEDWEMDEMADRRLESSSSELLGTPKLVHDEARMGRLSLQRESKDFHDDSAGQPDDVSPLPTYSL